MNEFPILLFLAIAHTIFCAIFILNKKNRSLHDLIACLWLFFICLATVRRSLHISYGDEIGIWFIKIIFYPLTYGPCLYLYTRIQARDEKKWNYKDSVHFSPFILFTFFSFLPNISFASLKNKTVDSSASLFFFQLFSIVSWASISIYSYLVYQMIKAHFLNVLEKFSYLSIDNTLSWVNRFSILFLIVLSIQNIISLYTNFSAQSIISGKVNGWLLLGFLYVLSFFFIRQDSVFGIEKKSEHSVKKEKYSKSGLTDEKMEELARSLVSYMESEKPYLKSDLMISDIANALNINVNHLSQVINARFQKNFFMFINDYRVADVISKMKHPDYSEFPVLRIAYEAGFNSKSSFNSIFRKATGVTPVEFRVKK